MSAIFYTDYLLEPHTSIDQQRYNLLRQTNSFVSYSQATPDITIVPRTSPGMDDTERRTVKRSRFDQTEPEPRKASRFDRRSRSPPSRRSESGRDRSPIAKDETPEMKKSPTDAAAAAGMSSCSWLYFDTGSRLLSNGKPLT